jgi:ketosteroid isomerase-like protein
VTVFGAAMSATGQAETQATFDWVASRFTGFESAGWEILSADVSGDLAYVVAIEHTTTSIGGAPAESYSLRATTILRREDGEWRAFHRHADPAGGSEPARDRLLGGAAESTGAR